MKLLTLLTLNIIEVEDLQSRVHPCQDTVNEYAERMAAGVKFPPVVVFHDGSGYYLADGFHRLLAAVATHTEKIECDVRKGTRADARWFAAGSNQTHGLRRTNDDKRKCVGIALQLKPNLSDRAIAEHCGVGHPLVAEIRRQVEEIPPDSQLGPRTGKDGKKYPPPPSRRFGPPPTDPPRIHAGPPPEPEPVRDRIGRAIPDPLVELWNRAQEVQDWLTALSRVKCALERAQKEEDQLYSEVNHSATLAALDQAYTGLKVALPYTVCPTCQGKVSNTCRLCKGRGLISEFRWDRVVSKETKALITKMVEAKK
jgi:hypothetical protein